MQTRPVLIALLATISMSAIAQVAPPPNTLAERVTSCAKDNNEASRLACFDNLAAGAINSPIEQSASASTAAPSNATEKAANTAATPSTSVTANPTVIRDDAGKIVSVGNWHILRETDELTDNPEVTIMNRGRSNGSDRDVAGLLLLCRDKQFEITVALAGC